MPAANKARFLINLAGMQHLSVLGFSGTEALDEVYEIIINIIAPQPLDASLLQQPVCLTLLSQYSDSNTALPADQHPRYINGVVDTLTQTGYQADSGYEYTITVVPQLALLKHRRRYQIFQQQNVPAIVGQLLKEAGITAVKQQLQGSYTTRDYCVQYGESDLEFIQRILSEAGIFFYFEHTVTDHTLVLQDNMMQSQDLTPLMYHPHTGQVPDGSVVTQWTVTHKVTPGVTSGRTYDFTRPHTKEESFEVTHSDQKNTTMLQQDQGLQPVQDDLTKPNASRRQQELAERDQIVVKGKTDSIECLPGYYLLLKDHPDASNNTLWLLTKVTHKGMQPQVKEAYASQRESGSYQATFEAVHQHLSWRPSIIKKPQQTGPQTAIVTGPEGQEIFTDNYGRVKVQFHWDRKAQGDDKSSAWLRVVQQWAGAGYGTFSLPRVGHEVLVNFLNHDIDQPVITGSLHNGTNKPAYSLLDNKTRSGIKTLSSPGGNTDNELRFDDKQGQEQIYIHAGKDFAQQIDNDQHIVVNNDHHHTTKNNHYQQVQGEQHTTVNKGSFTTVQGSVNETVQGSVQTKVAKSHLLNAGKTIHVKAGQHVVFNAGKTLTLKAGGKFLTINSNGVSVSSGIKISSGGSSGAADAAPKTAAMPGSVDKAGFGQTPIPESAQTPEVLTALAKGQVLTAAQVADSVAAKKQAEADKAATEQQQKKEDPVSHSLALLPLRYALVNTAPDASLKSVLQPALTTQMKPTGVRTVREGFLYTFHEHAPNTLLEYTLTPAKDGSTTVKRTGQYQPESTAHTSDDALAFLTLQQQPEAAQCVLMPDEGQLLVLFTEQKMTDFKRSQFLNTPVEKRQQIMQPVYLSKEAVIEGGPHLLPFEQADKGVTEYAATAPLLKDLSAPEQSLASYLKIKDAYFWSSTPFIYVGSSGVSAYQQQVPSSVPKGQSALLLVEDFIGVAEDTQTGALLAKGAQAQWHSTKGKAGHANNTLQSVANIIADLTCVTRDTVSQVLQSVNVPTPEITPSLQTELLNWARQVYAHYLGNDRLQTVEMNAGLPGNMQQRLLQASHAAAQIQAPPLPEDPSCVSALGDQWSTVKSQLMADVQQAVNLRLHGEGGRAFSAGLEDVVDYADMQKFAAQSEQQLTAWHMLKSAWVQESIRVIDALNQAIVAIDFTDATGAGLLRARGLVYKHLIALGSSKAGNNFIRDDILVKGNALLRVFPAAEPEKELLEGPGSLKEWAEWFMGIFKDELASGFIKYQVIHSQLKKVAQLPSDEVLENSEVAALSHLTSAFLAPFTLSLKTVWQWTDESSTSHLVDKLMQGPCRGAVVLFAQLALAHKTDMDFMALAQQSEKVDQALTTALQHYLDKTLLAEMIARVQSQDSLTMADKMILRRMRPADKLGQIKALANADEVISDDTKALLGVQTEAAQVSGLLNHLDGKLKMASENVVAAGAGVVAGSMNKEATKFVDSLGNANIKGFTLKPLLGMEGLFMVATVIDLMSQISNAVNKVNMTAEDRIEFGIKVLSDGAYLWTTLLKQKKEGLQKNLAVMTEDRKILRTATDLQKVITVIAKWNGLAMLASGMFGVWEDWQQASEANEQGQPAGIAWLYKAQAGTNMLFGAVGANNLLLAASKRTVGQWIQRAWQGPAQVGDTTLEAVEQDVSDAGLKRAEEETTQKVTARIAEGIASRMVAADALLGPFGTLFGMITLALDFVIYEATLDKLTLWANNSAWGNSDAGWNLPLHLYHLAPIMQASTCTVVINAAYQAAVVRQSLMYTTHGDQQALMAQAESLPVSALTLSLPGLTPMYAQTLLTAGRPPALCILVETSDKANWNNQLKGAATELPNKPLFSVTEAVISLFKSSANQPAWLDITAWMQPYIHWNEQQFTFVVDFSHLPARLQPSLLAIECRLRYQPPMLKGFIPQQAGDKTVTGNQVSIWQMAGRGSEGLQKPLDEEKAEGITPNNQAINWHNLPVTTG